MALDLFRRRSEDERTVHGDRLPPGQKLTDGWPVLHYGGIPRIDLATWRFDMVGLVEEEAGFTWEEFVALPQTTVVSDIHCVTHWSKFDNEWQGVAVRELLSRVRLKPSARHVMVHSYGGYTSNVPLAELASDDAAASSGAAETLLLEERQVGARLRLHGGRAAGLLGAVRVPHPRRPVERRALLLTRPGRPAAGTSLSAAVPC